MKWKRGNEDAFYCNDASVAPVAKKYRSASSFESHIYTTL